MLILEYLGYVALYGYAVFGLFYISSKFYTYQGYHRLDNLETFSKPNIRDSTRRALVQIFEETGITNLESARENLTLH